MRLEALPFIFVAGVAAAATAFFLTPLAMRLAQATGAMDEPDSGRRVHLRPIARGGGLAVAASFLGIGLLSLYLNEEFGFFRALRVDRDQLAALFIGAALAAGFGYIDDRWQNVEARWQFGLQVVVAIVAIVAGVTITFIANPLAPLFGDGTLGETTLAFGDVEWIVWLVTALWVVGMINSINFIDGLDGLSTGVALIAAVTLGMISLTADLASYAPTVALLCAVLAGALAGFLPWNFHPAKVFIGTTGVMFAGYALAVLSILGTAKVAVALLILGVPIIDTFYIIVRRLLGHSPFTPDRGHIHHRLLDLGISHRDAVLVIYGLTIALAILGLIFAGGAAPLYAFLGILIGFGLIIYLLTWRSGREAALEALSYPEDDEPAGDAGPADAGAEVSSRRPE